MYSFNCVRTYKTLSLSTKQNENDMTTKKEYKTGNTATGQFFTITETGTLNVYIKLYDCSGFIGNKIIPQNTFKNYLATAAKLANL